MEMTEQTLEELISGPYDFRPPQPGDVREGVILSLENHQAIVDIGAKREGVVPRRDLELLGEEAVAQLAVGDEVAVYVMRLEDRDGNLRVSINRAQQEADWDRASELLESETVWEAQVVGHNRGGLLIPFGRLQGFIPQSHVAELPRGLTREQRMARLPELVGQSMPVKVVEVDRDRRRLVFSNRSAAEAWRSKQRGRLLEALTEGEVVHGTVSSLCDFGAFVDLGGADGLVHVSELAWERVKHPSDVLEEGQEIDVYVLRLDHDRERIGLSLKRLQPDPWSLAASKYAPGDVVEGTVANVLDFGAFVRVEEGLEGLVHASEMPAGLSPQEAVCSGERVLVRVLQLHPDRRRMGLSLQEVTGEERAEWRAQQDADAPPPQPADDDESLAQ